MGSHMARYLLEQYEDVQVTNLDALTYAGNLENVKDLQENPRYTFVRGDICDDGTVDRIVGVGVDVIINYAAETHVDRSIMDPKAFLLTDVLGTHTLLEAAKKYSVKTYIQISTDEVFGSIAEGEFTEESPFEPNSPYSASKAGGDHLCRAYYQTYQTPVIVTHSCNFFGPNQYPEKLIPLFITNLIEGKKIPLYGDGLNEREWIYTEDHCRAIDTIMQHGVAGGVYNIGTGWRLSNRQIAMMLLTEFGAGEERIEVVTDRPGHDRRYAINANKLRALGWAPTGDFTSRLHETVEWYKNNQDWWKKVKNGEYKQFYQKQYRTKSEILNTKFETNNKS